MPTSRGFILVVVLWILVAMAIAVSAFAAWVSSATELAIWVGDDREATVDRFATLESLKFLLASHPSRVSGLIVAEEPQLVMQQWRSDPMGGYRLFGSSADVRFDGTWYRGIGNVAFSIQDESGLVGLNQLDQDRVMALLGQFGIPLFQRRLLVENLQEYRRFSANPAREVAYRSSGLPPPPRRALLVPMETRWVLGWGDKDILWQGHRWLSNTSAVSGGVVNINTAPRDALASLPDIGPARAALLIEHRKQGSFSRLGEVEEILGRTLNPLSFMLVSGESLRVTISDIHSGRAISYTLELTPSVSGGKPWRIHSVHAIHGEKFDQSIARPVEHPILAASQTGLELR